MSSINGFGTTFYGKCDYSSDGTYITTYWIILVYLPIIPLYSARILHVTPASFTKNSEYQYQRLPIHWQQVGRIWGFILVVVLGCIVCSFGLEQLEKAYAGYFDGIGTAVLIWYVLIMASIPHILRHRAKKKVGFNTTPAVSQPIKWIIGLFLISLTIFILMNHR